MQDWAGFGAIVTGGASGLGAATARRLADDGLNVTLFDLNEELGMAHAKITRAVCPCRCERSGFGRGGN